MSQQSPAEKPPKIRTFARLAWSAAFRAVRQTPVIFVASLVVLSVVGVAASLATAALDKVEATGWLLKTGLTLAGMAVSLARMILTSLALAPVAIAVHRLVVLGEPATGATSFGNRRWRQFAAWLLGFQLLNSVSQLPAVIYGAGGTFGMVAVGAVAMGVLTLRSSLLFPAVATDVPGGSVKERVELSWERTAGVSLRMIFVLLLAELPFLVLWAVAVLLTNMSAAHPETPRPQALIWIAAVINPVAALGGIAIGAAAVSWFYLWVLDHPRQKGDTAATPR